MLTVAFSTLEIDRLCGCLSRLLPHLRRDQVAITGGVAIQLGLAAAGRSGSRESIADIDFAASGLDAVSDSVSSSFLVSHYHVPQPGVPKFMIQLVDPVSRMRVDIFPDLVASLAHARRFTIGDQSPNVLDLQSILNHKLLTLSKASNANPVDPKHYRDARALASFFGREMPPVPDSALAKDVYGIEADVECRRCALSRNPGFPLAPKHRIFNLLGYT
jgi:hypothetical protein